MPDSGSVTVTGLDAYRRAVNTLPADVRQALQAVAEATAVRVQTASKSALASRLKTDRHALIDAIIVKADPANHQVQVISNPPVGQHRALPIFVEYGTRFMSPRPYMRPAADAANAQYHRDVEAAAVRVAQKALG